MRLNTPFKTQNRREWVTRIQRLASAHPEQTEISWSSTAAMTKVLATVAGGNVNHLLLPDGGGMDVHEFAHARQHGHIELHMSGKLFYLVRPVRLVLHILPELVSESFFWMETSQPDLAPLDGNAPDDSEVVELRAGTYVPRSAWDNGYWGSDEDGNDLPLPAEARLVVMGKPGKYVLTAKGSVYNAIPATYGGEHNKITMAAFRAEVEAIAKRAMQHGHRDP
jgi:serine/threonine-protein kinase